MPKIPSKRKKRRREEVEDEIMKYLASIDHPRTTSEVAEATGLNWYSAMAHLTRLEAQGRVFHKKIGRQDQWFDVDVNESRRLVKSLKKRVEKQDKIIKNQDRRIRELESKIAKLLK
ncbi:hypothetical protein DRP07_02500 [Archaeoglobales archaeon]|nr:MAG: hypothetical protein DRP07_02500 [Archaeoglobales archaeon]